MPLKGCGPGPVSSTELSAFFLGPELFEDAATTLAQVASDFDGRPRELSIAARDESILCEQMRPRLKSLTETQEICSTLKTS